MNSIKQIPTSGTTVAATSCDLRYGDNNNNAVRYGLQQSLNNCFGPNGSKAHVFSPALTMDGDFGTKTQEALLAVQDYLDISIDGSYGPQTRDAMWWGSGPGGPCAKIAQPIQLA
ncbi:peptidoglycan-binding protein [Catellatospora bangladeshensis]|uniref:peptidoglycan-binding domain-containing protein n=1 Tax=Catellatospora bangladeshensis TaxID=310355 RepID=UPI00360B4F1D